MTVPTETPPKLALQGMTPDELVRAVRGLTLADARRIVAQVHRDEDVATPSSLVRRSSRELVCARGFVPALAVVAERRSQVDPFVKYALRTHDDHVIETVRIPLEHPGRFSVCVSSQVGCALRCTFCATGRMGLSRNLETWEIVEQVRVVRRGLVSDGGASVVTGSPAPAGAPTATDVPAPAGSPTAKAPRAKGSPAARARVHGVVFQGMGEPLSNLDRVLAAIAVMQDPSALAIDARAITVCTSGLPAGIRRLAREAPKVRLGWSIASARRDVRRRLMPIDRAHDLSEVLAATVEHAHTTGLAPMWAVTLLAGVNDHREDAEALADLVHTFRDRAGTNPRLSIIPYNRIDDADDPFTRTADDAERAFREILAARSVFTHKRYSGGGDVAAACGQLAARA